MGPPQPKNEKKSFPVIKDDYGNIVNPYIPRFIVKTPWYVATKGGQLQKDMKSPLGHQRVQSEEGQMKTEIKDPQKEIFPAQSKTYKKGACANCGAITHRTEECVERPKAKGAKWTGKVDGNEVFFQPEKRTNFDAKRDRWRGYDPEKYLEVISIQQSKLEHQASLDTTNESKSSSDFEEEMGEEEEEEEEDIKDTRSNKGNKHLRIREDTVKYLKDLKSDSAAYDPKTRSMRDAASSSEFVPSDPLAASEQVFAWQGKRDLKKSTNPSHTHSTSSATTTTVAKTEDEKKRLLGIDLSLAKSCNDNRYNY